MKLFVYAIFFGLCLSSSIKAQGPNAYRLSVFGTRDGLLSPKIYALAQTAGRHLWIGTEIGASRYDGYAFQNVQYTAAQEQIGKIVAMAEDSTGGFWLGGEGGLFYYDGSEVCRCVFVKNYLPAVESLLTDNEGSLWIGEMHGLYRLTKKEMNEWRITKAPLQLKPFLAIRDRINCLDGDDKGTLYYGSFEGVFQLAKGATKSTLFWRNNNPANLVRFVTALSSGAVFFNQYNGESTAVINGAVKEYREEKSIGQRFFKGGGKVYRLTTSSVERMQDGSFVPFINFGLQTNFAFDALCDAEGNFWLGTWEGLFKYRHTPFAIYHRTEKDHPETFSFLERRDGRLLFGGNRGAIDVKNGTGIEPLAGLKPAFHLAEVLAMYEHDDGSLWFGSGYEGITRFQNGKYRNFTEATGLPDNHCNNFFRVNEHAVFACTEKGVLFLDPLADEPLKAHYGFAKAYNRQPKILGVFRPQPSLFLFYSNGGLFRLANDELQTETIEGVEAGNVYITRMAADGKGRIWLATQGKGLLLCRWNGDGLTLQKQYTKKEGLLSDELLSLLVDKNDRLWVAGYTSLSLLQEDGDGSRFINFTERDGLPTDYYQHLHLVQQKDGRVWALTSMNLFSFHPDSIVLNDIPPELFLNTVSLDNDATTTVALTGNHLFLNYRQNNLSFSFTAISLSNPESIKYAYRLAPGDTSWVETAERSLRFASLKSGRYNLELKAANNSGLWSAPLRFSFEIARPFWATGWFYAALTALGLLGVYLLFKRRLKAEKDKAAVRQQLTELESKALRAQMNPHFIFNSLNAIQELVVTQNADAAYDYLSRFSKLLRQVLNNSEKPSVPLSDEMSMLQLYLELESLRFRSAFAYRIEIDNDLDAETLMVPPLLLQPFIENALWHGLMLKEGEKSLVVKMQRKNGLLLCTVADNGIGRKKAGEIKRQKLGAQHFDSKGMQLSRHRIELLRETDKQTTVHVEDLYEAGEAVGTSVAISLPLVYA